MAVEDTIARRSNVQHDGVQRVRRYPCVRQDEHFEAIVSDEVVDQGGLLAG